MSATELDLRARQILRSGSQEMFMHHVDEVRDGSECGLARNEVKMSGGRFVLVERCKRSDQICRQDRFIAQHLEEWEGASRGLISHATRKNDREMGGLGMKIAANPPFGKGKNCYARSGDISISCECAAEETLLTTDASFEAIAKERGLNVKRFEGTAPP